MVSQFTTGLMELNRLYDQFLIICWWAINWFQLSVIAQVSSTNLSVLLVLLWMLNQPNSFSMLNAAVYSLWYKQYLQESFPVATKHRISILLICGDTASSQLATNMIFEAQIVMKQNTCTYHSLLLASADELVKYSLINVDIMMNLTGKYD